MNRKLRVRMLAAALALLSVKNAEAQAPGGVAPAAWYRADAASLYSDAGTTQVADQSTVFQWNSQVGSYPLLQSSATRRPVYSNTNLANFNPTVTFDGSNDFLETAIASGSEMIERASGTIYAAGLKDRLKRSGFAGFHPTMDYPGLHVFSNYRLLFFTAGGPGYQGLSADAMVADKYFTTGSGWLNGDGGGPNYASASVSLDGIRSTYGANNINNVNLTNNARNFRVGGDSNYGSFSGQLNELMVFENKLTDGQMDQVESYLAIKYGSTYANGTRDYKNAAGGTVWAQATNSGFNQNIAGIAHDVAGALYQKQSWSTNPGQQVLIGAAALAETNALNGGSLADGQYLIWGDNGLAKTPTVPTSAFAGLSHHFPAIWRVQNTGSVGTVRVAWPKGLRSLSLVQSADAAIGAGDVVTDMTANEVTIGDVVYNYADVTLSNGQYFTFAAKVPAPGGVTAGLTQWYRADEGLVAAGGPGTNVTSWTDFSRGTVSAQISTAPLPFYRQGATNYFNFNPGVNFTAIQQMLGNINTQTLESTNYDIFTLTKEGMTGTRFFNIGMNNTRMWGDNWDQPGLYPDGRIATRNSSGGGLGITNPGNIAFSTTTPNITYLTATNTSFRKGVNGGGLGTQWNVSARGQMTGGHIFGSNHGTNPPRGDDWGFVGHIGEVIVYGAGNLNATDRNRVDSYLAVKYGLTLPSTVNYLDSNGDIVWNSADNSTYHNNVAGITHDESSALNQKQSISVNPGQQVLIGTTGLANTNAANGNALTDGQYLMWGDNGLGKVPSVGISGVSGVNYRFASVWKVQNTDAVGAVRVTWPTGYTNLTLVQSTDPTFASVSSSHDMVSNTTIVNGVAYNYVDVTLTDGIYFTFAAQLNGPGGVGGDLRVWLRSDAGFAPNSWTDFSGNENHYTQTNETRQPFVAEKSYNFNPVIDFGGSTSASGRFMVVPSGRPFSANGLSGTFFTATLTRSGGTSGYRDIWGFGGTTTGSGLTNANSPAVTKLNNDIVLYNSTNSAFSGQYPDNKLLLTDASYTVGVQGIHYGLDGAIASTTQTRTAANSLQANGSVLGSQPEVTNGVIGEAIAYERDLTEAEKQRVRTYVAIKYGVTLPHDYIASDATTLFWEQANHAGYTNNIAGIARDDYGSLNQRQSQSINSGREVLISTLGLSDLNATNPIMLADQQALLWGDNGLDKSASEPFGTIGGLPYQRFAAIWQVQNTSDVGTVRVAWPSGLANLKLIQSDDDVIDLSDNITDMTGTQTVNGIEYAYADVTIDDGEYFTFAAFIQAPGGVFGHNVWLRANSGTSTTLDGAELNSWTNFGGSGGETEPLIPANGASKFQRNAHNFNPAVQDNTTGVHDGLLLRDVYSSYAHRDLSTFVLQSQPNVGAARTMVAFGNNATSASALDEPWFASNNTTSLRFFWQSSYQPTNTYPNSLSRTNNVPSINSFFAPMWTANPHTVTTSMNGATTTGSGNSNASNGFGQHLFIHGDGGNNNTSEGSISEVIAYDKLLTDVEKQRVNSYLAIKYGITLFNGVGVDAIDYLSSNEAVVYAADAIFRRNIAGLGHDFISTLNQKQSRSVNTNTGQVTIALGDIAETNAANTGTLADGQFLIWGDNGNTQAMTDVASSYTAFVYAGDIANGRRMNRVWKVQNTNNVADEVLIRFPKASVHTASNPSFGANEDCAAYVMISASDPDFTNNVTYKEVELTDDELNYDVRHTFPNGASYFTYGKVIPFNQGTVYLPGETEVSEEYITDCAVGEWRYFNPTGDTERKLIGFSGFDDHLGDFEVTITPEGTIYEADNRTSALMARITTVTDNGATYTGTKKVRVYYDASELAAATVDDAEVSGWFKYEGDADEVLIDIFSDGLFDPAKAVALTPDASGVEDGVNYVEFHNITSFSSFVYFSTTEDSPLPVSLVSFSGTREGQTTLLSWATTSELQNRGFEVERSADARSWSTVGFVEAASANGNSTAPLSYRFTDGSPLSGRNYYRLKQLDLDGGSDLSHVVIVNFDAKAGLMVYPNPVVGGVLKLDLTGSFRDEVRVFNMTGIEVLKSSTTKGRTVDVRSLQAGQYVLQVVTDEGERINKVFIVP